jgi:hypothetical protein
VTRALFRSPIATNATKAAVIVWFRDWRSVAGSSRCGPRQRDSAAGRDPGSLAARAARQQAAWLSVMGGWAGVPAGASHGLGYMCGERQTEADWRLFTTLVRFDPVYVGHFKCNIRRLVDYPNLWSYTRELYQVPGILETVDFGHIKGHYYQSHGTINPTGIVPLGPAVDFDAPPPRTGACHDSAPVEAARGARR